MGAGEGAEEKAGDNGRRIGEKDFCLLGRFEYEVGGEERLALGGNRRGRWGLRGVERPTSVRFQMAISTRISVAEIATVDDSTCDVQRRGEKGRGRRVGG